MSIQQTDQPLAGYPEHYLLGIVDDQAEAAVAATELHQEGIEEVQVLTGKAGADLLDSDGSEHGLLATLLRTIEHIAAEIDHLGEYERAVREGAAVVAAYVEEEPSRERATEILRRHDARFVNYFGPLAVELVVR